MVIKTEKTPSVEPAESEDKIEIRELPVEKLLADPKFVQFLGKYKDAADLDPEADAAEIMERRQVFEQATKVSEGLSAHFKQKYEKELGVRLDKAHYEAMAEALTEMAINKPEDFARYQEEWQKYQKLPGDIAKLDQEINALKPEQTKKEIKATKEEFETMRLAAQTGIGDSVRNFFNSPEDNIVRLKERDSEGGRKEFFREMYEKNQGNAESTLTGDDIDAFNRYLSGKMPPEEFEAYIAESGFGQEVNKAYEEYLSETGKRIKENEDWRKRLDARAVAQKKGLIVGFSLKNGPTAHDEQIKLGLKLDSLEKQRGAALEKTLARRELHRTLTTAEEEVLEKNSAVKKVVEFAREALNRKKAAFFEAAKAAVEGKKVGDAQKLSKELAGFQKILDTRTEFADLLTDEESGQLQEFIEDSVTAKIEEEVRRLDFGKSTFDAFTKQMRSILDKGQIGNLSGSEIANFVFDEVTQQLGKLDVSTEAGRSKALMLKVFLAKIKRT